MKINLEKIAVGKPTKYKKAKLDVARVVAAYNSGKNVAEIARDIYGKPNVGNNRVRRVLEQAGIYKALQKKAAKKAKAA